MSQLIVRRIEPEIVQALRERAARNGHSAEAEHRLILREALLDAPDRGSFKALLASMPDTILDDELAPARDLPRDLP